MRPKQVIVLRKFPSGRIGKYCNQAAHASMAALLACAKKSKDQGGLLLELKTPQATEWIEGKATKTTVYVETELGLFNLQKRCQEENIPHALIQDSGMTEFKGELAFTALGIGPDDPDKIDKVTGELPLF